MYSKVLKKYALLYVHPRSSEGESQEERKKKAKKWWVAERKREQKVEGDKMRGEKKEQKHLYCSVTVCGHRHYPCGPLDCEAGNVGLNPK